MNKEITEKLKDQNFANKVANAKDEAVVKKLFSDENISTTDSDITELKNLFQNVAKTLQEVPEAEIDKIAGGERDGVVDELSGRLNAFANRKYWNAEKEKTSAKKFYDELANNSDKVVEGTLAVALVGATIGAQKLYHHASGWWTGHKK
jgi:soluble P-type ATPase